MTLAAIEHLGPARLVVTDRRGGVSRSPWDALNLADHVGDDDRSVAANRRIVADLLGVADVAVVAAEHGGQVHRVAQGGTGPCGDALVTTHPGLALLALGGDCIAGALVAPEIGAVAVFHSGWRGVAARIAPATVASLRALGADPASMACRLGPGICPGCYEVSAEIRQQVAVIAPTAAATTRWGTPSLNLVAGVTEQLRDAGVRQVAADARCTFEDPDLYSHRRDGVTGRHGIMAVIGGS